MARERIGRHGKADLCVDLRLRWSLRASLGEHLRARGDALVTDVNRRDDGAGVGISHSAPEKSFGTCSLDLPQNEQTSEARSGGVSLTFAASSSVRTSA